MGARALQHPRRKCGVEIQKGNIILPFSEVEVGKQKLLNVIRIHPRLSALPSLKKGSSP